ncbi:hypothetical protein BS47DRAFT_1367932 [Hydnum rufescens UP504]|uniref:Uncharacterized protein n=1 Tax=Hydnum rufescens UP504 TaxID=1448309 RepID=A0A9P6AHG0_9AGAM|nr:hypothetical protein BS47DRAFT_1367932 [Hydnum rufescens UP504]
MNTPPNNNPRNENTHNGGFQDNNPPNGGPLNKYHTPATARAEFSPSSIRGPEQDSLSPGCPHWQHRQHKMNTPPGNALICAETQYQSPDPRGKSIWAPNKGSASFGPFLGRRLLDISFFFVAAHTPVFCPGIMIIGSGSGCVVPPFLGYRRFWRVLVRGFIFTSAIAGILFLDATNTANKQSSTRPTQWVCGCIGLAPQYGCVIAVCNEYRIPAVAGGVVLKDDDPAKPRPGKITNSQPITQPIRDPPNNERHTQPVTPPNRDPPNNERRTQPVAHPICDPLKQQTMAHPTCNPANTKIMKNGPPTDHTPAIAALAHPSQCGCWDSCPTLHNGDPQNGQPTRHNYKPGNNGQRSTQALIPPNCDPPNGRPPNNDAPK